MSAQRFVKQVILCSFLHLLLREEKQHLIVLDL